MSTTDRTEYPAILDTISPSQAATILNERVRSIGKTNAEIADWLQERRKVEEQYVLGLRKLARRGSPDDSTDLGIFGKPWQNIVRATEALAESHQNLAQKIAIDVETPLRDYAAGSRDMQRVTTTQGNLGAMAKDYEKAQRNATKDGKKATDFENEVDRWQNQAPFIFESLQVADETRCNHLRDVLTQFQTHEVDQIERSRKSAEAVLNSLLNLDTADEIRSFASRNTGSATRVPTQRSGSRASATVPAPRPERMTSESLMPPPSIPAADDRASQRSSSIQEDKKRGFGSGLKRLGTVMGRRRQSAIEPRSTPKKKSGRYESGLPRMAERPPSSRDSRDQASPPTAFTPLPPVQLGSNSNLGQTNGESAFVSDTVQPPAAVQPPTPERGLQQPLQPLSASKEQRPLSEIPPQVPAKDNEGYSVPPPADDPISQTMREASEFGDGADASGQAFKMDIRNAPIAEENNGENSAAMATMASTLRAQQNDMPKRSATARGRRDNRNTVLLASAQPGDALPRPIPEQEAMSSPPLSTLTSSFISQTPSGQTNAEHTRASESVDAQSIRSGRSLSTIGASATKHPDLTGPGLKASAVETLNAWQESGVLSHISVTGEIALAFDASAASPTITETVRLEDISSLEALAPNPSLVNEVPGKSGEYTVDLKVLSPTSPLAAFKYTLRLDGSAATPLVPMVIRPSWKIDGLTASAIVQYSINPAFLATLQGPVSLSGVVIGLYLDGKAKSCQSKPVGTFAKERSMIYWTLDEMTLSPGSSTSDHDGKVIARFTTLDAPGKPGRVEAKWATPTGTAFPQVGPQLKRYVPPAAGADPFADEDAASSSAWHVPPTVRKVSAGTYVAT